MSRDNTNKLPWWMIGRLDCSCCFVELKRTCEVVIGSESGWLGYGGIVYLSNHAPSVRARYPIVTLRVSAVNDDRAYSRPAVIIFLCSFGRAGPTGPCCDRRGAGSCFTSLYSSFIFTDNRIRALHYAMRRGRSGCFQLRTSSPPL